MWARACIWVGWKLIGCREGKTRRIPAVGSPTCTTGTRVDNLFQPRRGLGVLAGALPRTTPHKRPMSGVGVPVLTKQKLVTSRYRWNSFLSFFLFLFFFFFFYSFFFSLSPLEPRHHDSSHYLMSSDLSNCPMISFLNHYQLFVGFCVGGWMTMTVVCQTHDGVGVQVGGQPAECGKDGRVRVWQVFGQVRFLWWSMGFR